MAEKLHSLWGNDYNMRTHENRTEKAKLLAPLLPACDCLSPFNLKAIRCSQESKKVWSKGTMYVCWGEVNVGVLRAQYTRGIYFTTYLESQL